MPQKKQQKSTLASKLVLGVTVYRIEERRLVGRWATMPGNTSIAEETLTWLGELEE